MTLETELQLAQITNCERALGIAERAKPGDVEAGPRPGSESGGVTVMTSGREGRSR